MNSLTRTTTFTEGGHICGAVMIGETVTTNNTNLTNQRKDLKATGYRLGLLVNFGAHGKLQYERIVR